MADNLDAVKAEAVSRLQAALVSGDAVGDAIRWMCYRNPVFMFMLFAAAVCRRFGPGTDADEIAAFVRRAAPAGDKDAAAGFPAREAELMIRACLGELALIGELDPELNYAEIAARVLDRLFSEWPPGPVEVDELFGEAREAADFAGDVDPDVALWDSAWFASGMHASPFAYPLEGTVRGWGSRPVVPASGPADPGSLEAAVASYTDVLASDPGAMWALCRRAQAYQGLGRLDEALADCARALGRDPAAAWAFCRRGEIYEETGRHDEALAAFSRGAELRPSAGWAIAGRARALQALGRYDEAAAEYGRGLALNPDADWALGARGETYMN